MTAATTDFGSTLVAFIGNGDGAFKPGAPIPTDFGPGKVAVTDFNGDSKLDLVMPLCCGDSDITYLLGKWGRHVSKGSTHRVRQRYYIGSRGRQWRRQAGRRFRVVDSDTRRQPHSFS